MKNLQKYVMTEVLKDHRYYYSNANDLLVIFFPKLRRAYVEWKGKTTWYESTCTYHAIGLHLEANELELAEEDTE